MVGNCQNFVSLLGLTDEILSSVFRTENLHLWQLIGEGEDEIFQTYSQATVFIPTLNIQKVNGIECFENKILF